VPLTVRFSTAMLAPNSRPSALHGLAERGLLPVEPLPGRHPRVELAKWALPDATLLSASLAGVRQRGDTGGPACEELFFGVNLQGRSLARRRDDEVTIGQGDAVFTSGADGGFSMVRPDPVRFVGVRLARCRVESAVADRADARLRPVGRSIALELLTGYLVAVVGNASLADREPGQSIVDHLAELIGLAMIPARPVPGAVLRAARLEAIKADIELRLSQSDLSVERIAAAHGVTPRYVHKLFADDDLTCAQYVLRRRLERARRLLQAQGSGRPISAIAYDVGFGDLSYFNRTFRRQFQMTPSELRREAQHDASSTSGSRAGTRSNS
jgi:AraC-like DNA-binding protein